MLSTACNSSVALRQFSHPAVQLAMPQAYRAVRANNAHDKNLAQSANPTHQRTHTPKRRPVGRPPAGRHPQP